MEPTAPPTSATPDAPPAEPGQEPTAPPVAPPQSIQNAAEGDTENMTVQEERDGIYWLLQPARAHVYRSNVKYETPDGTKDLWWYFRQQDGTKIETIENKHKDGDGPFAQINQVYASPEIVAEATVKVVDKMTGRRLDLTDTAFLTAPSGELIGTKADALRLRFHFQSGVLAYLAEEVRRASGYSADRVGGAERVLVDATGN